MLKPFEFNEKVALEVILYIANKSQKPTFHHIAKLLYFADKSHLCQYGRFICGDNYIAMKNGPVPSHACVRHRRSPPVRCWSGHAP